MKHKYYKKMLTVVLHGGSSFKKTLTKKIMDIVLRETLSVSCIFMWVILAALAFGYKLFLMKAMVPKEITLGHIYKTVVPFVLIMLLCLGILLVFPGVATWLPDLYYAK